MPANSLMQTGPAGAIRGDPNRIRQQRTNCRKRENFFTNRVVKGWNKLPTQICESRTVNGFKNKFDKAQTV